MHDCLMQPQRAGLVAVSDIMLCIPLPRTQEQEVSLPVTSYLGKVSLGWEGHDYHCQGGPSWLMRCFSEEARQREGTWK